ncbi:nuclear transport factor 2 family protein [Nocardia sp. NPDC050378]|uniref:nuclear transport factor 2 family protein n=1 Tax=Nocardia sp. NPDC050378 TaxID=3155400 RepID=UPI0033CBCC33
MLPPMNSRPTPACPSSDPGVELTTSNIHREISDLITTYCRGVDGRDEKVFRSIWHYDAIYDVGGQFGTYTGTDQIVTGVQAIWDAFAETHHWTTNVFIDITSTDTAESQSSALAHMIDNEGKFVVCAADYADNFTKTGGGWKFEKRTITIHYIREISAPIYGSR